MRIAMIGQKGMPAKYGGVEQHVEELSLGLVRRGYDVTVYARAWYTGADVSDMDGVRIVHLPTIRTKHIDTMFHTLLSTFHAIWSGFDVIHYHGVGPSLLAFLPRILRPGARVIVTFHSIDRYHQKWGRFARSMLKAGEWAACHFSHETITVSRSLSQYCLNEYKKETVYIPNGVTMPKKQASDAVAALPVRQAGFGLAPGQYLLMVSRLVPHKGAHLLVEAFLRLKESHADDPRVRNLKLAIVGGSVYTDDYVAELRGMASGSSDIVFTGFVSGEPLASLYANAAALVHPSLSEGLPVTVLSAMSHGTPVLVSGIPEHLELTNDPRAIFVENDVDAIAVKIMEFLSLDANERQDMGASLAAAVSRHYDWRLLVPKIADVYEREIRSHAALLPSRQ